ncbi:hypothetical protein [Roseovarius aestuarii]|uniref:Uncharacterized protein n=1 Tax=Roseovarius aestuarii TaxID=475083 RepID=A0A1X7BR44_9RHOB|nr:hypothetical protein [Roseovarius aestuarii]SMC12102.1 hypothetical protein ROA7745_01925 [Roseovarius aestuarii]
MKNMVNFEVCGLYFILGRSATDAQGGAQFQLSDEALSSRPISIFAESFDELFPEIETQIALELSDCERDVIMSGLGTFATEDGSTESAPMTFEPPMHAGIGQAPCSMPCGI